MTILQTTKEQADHIKRAAWALSHRTGARVNHISLNTDTTPLELIATELVDAKLAGEPFDHIAKSLKSHLFHFLSQINPIHLDCDDIAYRAVKLCSELNCHACFHCVVNAAIYESASMLKEPMQ